MILLSDTKMDVCQVKMLFVQKVTEQQASIMLVEIPCWGIWVHFLLTEKYDFLKSIADSERKFIP